MAHRKRIVYHSNSTTCITKSILIQLNTNDEVQLRIANGSSTVSVNVLYVNLMAIEIN